MRHPAPSRPGAYRLLVLAAAIALPAWAIDVPVTLTGEAQSPPVTSSGRASGTFTVNTDRTISGSVATSDIEITSAHIHEGASGNNGPIILPLVRRGPAEWAVPDGARLSDRHYAMFQAGNLYVNMHTATHPAGELRAQLRP
jgi:hypothetical protein